MIGASLMSEVNAVSAGRLGADRGGGSRGGEPLAPVAASADGA
jgi:hypothetical protein